MDVDLPICATCGVQYPAPREDCPVCVDERQYVGWDGQQWVSMAELAAAGHRSRVAEEGPGVLGVGTEPAFPGGQVLHWAGADGGAGALLSGDIATVVPDRRWVSFMYSYPNLIPERPAVVERALGLVAPYRFESIYGAWWGRVVR